MANTKNNGNGSSTFSHFPLYDAQCKTLNVLFSTPKMDLLKYSSKYFPNPIIVIHSIIMRNIICCFKRNTTLQCWMLNNIVKMDHFEWKSLCGLVLILYFKYNETFSDFKLSTTNHQFCPAHNDNLFKKFLIHNQLKCSTLKFWLQNAFASNSTISE